MNTFLVLKGLPGSGKSTWAKEQKDFVRINKDDIRNNSFPHQEWSGKIERKVIEHRNYLINDALEDGKNIIIDDTNLNPIHIEYFKNILKAYPNYELEIKFFDTPLWQCIKNDSKREDMVGKDVIVNMWQKYLYKPIEQDKNLSRCIIVDIDGTVAFNNGKRGFYEWSKVGLDEPIESVCNIIKELKHNYKIIFVSGRDAICFNQTKEWIEENIGLVKDDDFDLYMRPIDDMRDDCIVKEEIFNQYIKDKFYIEFVLDDRDKVIDLWRGLGLTCLQCNYGAF